MCQGIEVSVQEPVKNEGLATTKRVSLKWNFPVSVEPQYDRRPS